MKEPVEMMNLSFRVVDWDADRRVLVVLDGITVSDGARLGQTISCNSNMSEIIL